MTGAPAVQLTLEPASVETNNAKRDAHPRSSEFFDVENHPDVMFVSETASLVGERLKVRGRLQAAGKEIPLEFDADLRRVGNGLEVSATVDVDHRELGMLWSPLGILRAPSKLILHGRLIPTLSVVPATHNENVSPQ